MTKLSDVPSEALLQALADLERVEQDPRYVISMAQWHLATSNRCYVCLAGATLIDEVPWDHSIGLTEFDDKTARKFTAIDVWRWGDITEGLRRWGIILERIDLPMRVVQYSVNPAEFKLGIQAVAARLKELGH